ncbi:hypothetical protein IQ07DRAFT_583769 [Pyrenochaeta sp. DS3sAY3a]|nr:hypothetical protein IQ07DRAFT_583769 [Pyrenochaeta sp. DS3sAY3a]
MSSLESLTNYSIYISLNLRGALPGFHWLIYMPKHASTGNIWHATNRTGGWHLEAKSISDVHEPMSFCLAYKIGSIEPKDWSKVNEILLNVDASGDLSPDSSEKFSCRIWAKNAMVRLQQEGFVEGDKSVEEIEEEATRLAEENRVNVERGKGGAIVQN